MKKLTRERVVPMISASVSWLICGITSSAVPSLPKLASRSSTRAKSFLAGVEELVYQIFFNANVSEEHMAAKTTPRRSAHRGAPRTIGRFLYPQ